MDRHDWQGVMPAITNPYHDDLTIDHTRLTDHVTRLADAGCTALRAPSARAERSRSTRRSDSGRPATPPSANGSP